MITRFRVSGFKNLLDLDVRFGPFTCILGPNGIGKSNLFDAIHFLSLLADRPIMEAAVEVRGRSRDIMSLFYRGADYVAPQMKFDVEFLVPRTGVDDFGQQVVVDHTFLKYILSIGCRHANGGRSVDQLVVLEESLTRVPKFRFNKSLGFEYSGEWRKSVVIGGAGATVLKMMSDRKRTIFIGETPRKFDPEAMRKTALNIGSALNEPAIWMARQEMTSWQQLQLDPSALRKADSFNSPLHLTASGEHLPSTLDRIAHSGQDALCRLANRLAELVGAVRAVQVDRDEIMQAIVASVQFADGTVHTASSLSDGTLRFLALAALEADIEFRGVLCLEEPENGIHPEKIPAMVNLLGDIAMDAHFPLQPENPLRQVVINTHSPACALEVPEDSLLIAERGYAERDGKWLPTIHLAALPGTWRANEGSRIIKAGTLLSYLRPAGRANGMKGRVADRKELASA